ncbi:morphogenetic protein [Serratia sp. CY38905]|uniref:morphogenetic protein n=1 Tax=Serratia sp. CY38905 TaxID=3383613 RepID=UPI003FA10A45
MKERPVIFNGEMVRAILDGRKTQTRRVMKVQPESSGFGLRFITESLNNRDTGKYFWSQSDACGINKSRSKPFLCPFGQVGDRLWVRETFQGPLIPEDELSEYLGANPDKFQSPAYCEYAADGGAKPEYVDSDENTRYGWRPSIHMPRWASRITLEITAVRVERLNDISEEDAKAEGAPTELCIIGEKHYMGFRTLWQSIYGEESWGANPWVWVIEFRRVEVRDASK